MKVLLSGINNVQVSISGNITEIDYQWFIRPLVEILDRFENKDSYFDKLFEILYKLQNWAKEKMIELNIKANAIFKTTYYFFCKVKENE